LKLLRGFSIERLLSRLTAFGRDIDVVDGARQYLNCGPV
jgi:hypothetical protein